MAKAINGGATPFGALWTDSSVAEYFASNTLSAGLTNYAHPLGLASSNAVLDYTKTNDFKNQLDKTIEVFENTVSQFNKLENVRTVRTIGVLAAIETNSKIPWEVFMEGGLHLLTKDTLVVLAPSLTMDSDTLTQGLEKLYQIIKSRPS